MTITKPFYSSTPLSSINDLILRLTDDEDTPITLINSSAATLEDLTSSLGIGWYRIANLYQGFVARTLFVFLVADPTVLVFQQSWTGSDEEIDSIYNFSSGNGIYPISLTLNNSDDDTAIVSANVSIWNSNHTTILVPALLSDSLGEVVVALAPGTYTAYCYKQNITFINPFTFTVLTAPAAFTINGTGVSSNPNITGFSTLYGYTTDLTMTPLPAVKILIRISPAGQVINGNVISKQDIIIYSDDSGYWSLAIGAGLHVSITIPSCAYSVSGVMPYSGSIAVDQLQNQFTSQV